jgi:hypothetical protein
MIELKVDELQASKSQVVPVPFVYVFCLDIVELFRDSTDTRYIPVHSTPVWL